MNSLRWKITLRIIGYTIRYIAPRGDARHALAEFNRAWALECRRQQDLRDGLPPA
jgi:hypothetical protein